MTEFFQMGGYAAFVWPAYGLTAVVLLGLTVLSLRAHKLVQGQVTALEAGRSAPPTPESK